MTETDMFAAAPEDDTAAPAMPTDLEGRRKLVENTIEAIYGNVLGLAKENREELPEPAAEILASVAVLAQCGLTFLAEIADAQQRIAHMADVDLSAHIDAVVEERTTLKVAEAQKETMKRSYIGMPNE